MDKVIDDIFEVELQSVSNSFPTIYSQSDVNAILGRLRMNVISLDFVSAQVVDEDERNEKISEIKRRFRRWLENNEFIDTENAEFSIGYKNQIELEHLNIDEDSIIDELDIILSDLL